MKFRNLTITSTVFILQTFLLTPFVFAVDCTGDLTTGGAPDIEKILCPLFKVVNIGIIMGGIIFAIMIGIGAIKLAVSLGDPKGLEGASRTWTYALVGVAIVLGAVTLVSLIGRVLGLNLGDLSSLFDTAASSLTNFVDTITIFN